MTANTLMALTLLIPLTGAVLIALTGRNGNLREAVTIITAILLFAVVVQVAGLPTDNPRPVWVMGEMLPGLEISFSPEPLGMIFALIASGLWIVTSFYAIGYMRAHKEIHQTRFYVCFAIAIASAMGIALSANMLTLFVFYEVLTISTYPLVAHAGSSKAKRGARIYLGILLGTSIGFQLVAIIWTWVLTGTLEFTDGGILNGSASGVVISVLLVLYVYGIGKAALMPFHRWLPAAMVAPTPVSALLHAVAVVKAGVFSVLKVAVYIFGIDLLQQTAASNWLAIMAAVTILLASIVALRQDNLKARLAYSTVSQLSYIVLAAMLASGTAIVGGGEHIVMHAFAKITLFFCAGAIMVASHKTKVSELNGLGRKMPITFFAFFLASLSLIGLPPFGGMWSKWLIGMGAAETDQWVYIAVLMISSLLNIAYLMPVVVRGFFYKPGVGGMENHHQGDLFKKPEAVDPSNPVLPTVWKISKFEEAPLLCVASLSFTALGTVALFFYADVIYSYLLPIIAR